MATHRPGKGGHRRACGGGVCHLADRVRIVFVGAALGDWVGGGSMTLKKKVICIIIATLMVIIGSYAVCLHEMICRYGLPVLDNPTVETRTTMYVVPWPWELEWQDNGFVMRLEIRK